LIAEPPTNRGDIAIKCTANTLLAKAGFFATAGHMRAFMPNDTLRKRTLGRGAARHRSTVAKLARAAGLAALFVLLGTAASEAAIVTCSFGTNFDDGGIELFSIPTTSCIGESPTESTFRWAPSGTILYEFTLTFVNLAANAGFDIAMEDQALTQSQFDALTSDVEALYGTSYDCIQLVSGPTPCRNFFLTGFPSDRQWDSYEFSIFWPFKSGATTATILHDITEPDNPNFLDNGFLYDEDMCIEYDNCTFDPDPEISSGDTDFSGFTPSVAVPEPGILLLMATGLGGIVYRRRWRARS
jgi:hypothetical protein